MWESESKMLFHQLDSLIEYQQEIIAAKKGRIKLITNGISGLRLTKEQQYEINNRLYDEYVAFDFDSAYFYISKNIEAQKQLEKTDLSAASLIRMSHILAVTGLFDKASEMLDGINSEQLSLERRVEFYNQRAELNLYRSEMAIYTPYFKEYIDSSQYYRQLIIQIAPRTSYDYIFNLATYTCEKGDIDKAINLLTECMPSFNIGDRRYSIITSTLAYFYSKKNDYQQQEHYLLLSAISDIQGAILENNSLRELSIILMERGEYKKAYTYLQQASLDAKTYGSRLRSLQVARLSPLVTKAYDLEREQTQQRTNLLLIIISIIALLLVGLVVFVLLLIKKRRLANERIHRMNKELSRHNEEIQHMNSLMKESNRIKDEYIGRFLELSSNLIHRGEERSKQLNRLARDRKLEELYTELKSQKPLNESIHQFHANFDTAFLNIYPDFVTEINKLMSAQNEFDMAEGSEKLSTELRVLALIRLGITDNQKIADILRSSITTIYTYRSRLKSRAIEKDSFEDDIKKISTY
ncbi:MAG: hypothetical protein IJ580_10170 [Prevotella sp.]|nr:hypothetical protein [Prevotella sp.]MBR1557092.1 hypothetical protein [Prevotella sp.]